jgi:hypothetical protein
MASECEDAAALQDLKWRDVWGHLVRRCGFVDMDGRLLPFARRYRAACQRGYRRGRRYFLAEQRTVALYAPPAETAPHAAAIEGTGRKVRVEVVASGIGHPTGASRLSPGDASTGNEE